MHLNEKGIEIVQQHIKEKEISCGACRNNVFYIFSNFHFIFQGDEFGNRPDLNLADLNDIKGMAVISIECANCSVLTQFTPRILGITPDMLK